MADKQTQTNPNPVQGGRQQTREPQQQEQRLARPEQQQSGLSSWADPWGGYGRWSPFSLMRRMMEDMDRLFEDFGGAGGGRGLASFTPQLEAFEKDGKLVVRADLP